VSGAKVPALASCPYSPKCLVKLSEKECGRRSERESGGYMEAKMG
jgi:hypothetical protein